MANTTQQQIERAKVLEDWSSITSSRLLKSIKKYGIGYSQSLYYSMSHKVIGSLSDETRLQHSFDASGRFVDMGVGRGQKIGDVKSNADLRGLLGIGRKPKKWYSKTYAAERAELRDIMMKKYAEQGMDLVTETISGKYL